MSRASRLVYLTAFMLILLQARADWTNDLTLTASNPIAGGLFGRAVYTYGDFAIVGDNSTSGGASVYIMPDTDWVEQARLQKPASEPSAAAFGAAVSLEASYAVVGAPFLDFMGQNLDPSNPLYNVSARTWVYERQLNSWFLQASVMSPQPGSDGFGSSIAVGGNFMVIGAPYASGILHGDGIGYGVTTYQTSPSAATPATPASPAVPSPEVPSSAPSTTPNPGHHVGAVYTYRRINDIWTATGALVPYLADDNDLFGWSVDISADGNRLIIGAPGDTVDGTSSGSVYVYNMDATGTWNLEAKLIAYDEEPFDYFGYAVAVDVSDVIVGTRTARSAYIFHKLADAWVQDAKLVAGDATLNDGFGQAVSIFGTYAIVGAPAHQGQGAAYLWSLNMDVGSWVQMRKLTTTVNGAHFGAAVSIGSRFLLAGAPNANHDIGQVLTLMLDESLTDHPVLDTLEDVVVLVRFSGSSTSIDLLVTRKVIADAAGTGTAQVELRLVDLGSTTGPVANHIFGLQIQFSSSAVISAGSAAQNFLMSLSDIRYRLNAAVGAVSGTAEIVAMEQPIQPPSFVSLNQLAAVIILVLLAVATCLLLFYYTRERRKKIVQEQRDFDAQEEAKKEAARKEKELQKENAGSKKPRKNRQSTVLRSKKRNSTYVQAGNDAAGLEFVTESGGAMFDDGDFLFSPRGGPDDDPTASIEEQTGSPRGHDDDGPSLQVDDGPRVPLDDGPALKLDDGPSIKMDDGPRIALDDGPSLKMDDGPRITFGDSPRIALVLDDGPKLKMSDPLGLAVAADDGPRFKLSPPSSPKDDGPSLRISAPPSPADDGPKIVMDDGPSLKMSPRDSAAAPSAAPSTPLVRPIAIPKDSGGHDSGNDSDSAMTPTSRAKRPANVPRLNLGFGPK